jgi:hypothetical protein
MALAAIAGRFLLKSRLLICLIAFLGASGAMVAHILYDGQGAFALLLFTPIIYFAAVAGRDEFGGRRWRLCRRSRPRDNHALHEPAGRSGPLES